MRAHYLQHVPFEGLGMIESWLIEEEYEVTSTRFFESDNLPNPDQINFLIILGGPMSVNEEKKFPWLAKEKRFIRKIVDSGKPVLGICLGAQLIANALGSKVYSNHEKEIGWFPLSGFSGDEPYRFLFPTYFEAFHWHGETFDLPDEAILLASSEACKNQAFQINHNVIGLQFHLEMTPMSIRQIITNCRNELIPSRYIQSEEKILKMKPERIHTTHQIMEDILHYLDST